MDKTGQQLTQTADARKLATAVRSCAPRNAPAIGNILWQKF